MSYAKKRAEGLPPGINLQVVLHDPITKTEPGRVFEIQMLRASKGKYLSASEVLLNYADYESAHEDYIAVKRFILESYLQIAGKYTIRDFDLDEAFFSDKRGDNWIEMALSSLKVARVTLYSVIIEEDLTPEEGELTEDLFYYQSNEKCRDDYRKAVRKLVSLYKRYTSRRYL